MKRTLIAAAVLASAASSAFASPYSNAYLFNVTGVVETVGISGWVTLYGCVGVSSTAGAVINNNQSVSLNWVSLNPMAQSYTVGAVTTSVNNDYSSVTDTGASAHASGQSSSFNASENSNNSYSSSNSSSSVSEGGQGSSFNAQQNSSLNASVNTNRSQNSGGDAFIAGGAVGASGFQTATTTTNYPSFFGYGTSSSSLSTNSSGYIVGAAGAVWGQSGYSNASDSVKAQSHATESASENSSGYLWSASASEDSGRSSQSGSIHSSENSSSSDYNVWGFTNTLSAVNVSTTGEVTQIINTEQPSTLTATTGKDAATGVMGNLGVNVAEGIDNAQSNDAALASVDVDNVFGNAQIFSNQSSSGRASVNDFNLNASVGDGSLATVSGNVGVNIASGVGNVQNNSLAASASSGSQAEQTAMVATDDNSQDASASVSGQFEGTAELGSNTLTGATGNIGVNIAGGVGNLQHNGLAIASFTKN